ncbi:MAG: 2-oxoglutarate ferredoxin oxidoreductase subunit gamma [Acidimicrobiaceae bacterium]|jgi:2-oxoglutarate ferredoxin oxidoreductase subunit gamma|nr:2-oxoglutarate ferredoxin oxidoreductase subunit gamma [Acidimicrobiaceae bacterium]
MEREVMFTGVGGQGVQIASKSLATAAIDEGRQVMLVPRYGGSMRGGMTNAEVTIADGPLRALPVATAAWSAYAMDPSYWSTIRPTLRSGAIVVVNSSLFTAPVDVPDATVFALPANDVASELESPMSAGFVLLGALVAVTGLVSVDSVVAAMQLLIPAYRTQHLEANERAIRAGAEQVPALAAPAWDEAPSVVVP